MSISHPASSLLPEQRNLTIYVFATTNHTYIRSDWTPNTKQRWSESVVILQSSIRTITSLRIIILLRCRRTFRQPSSVNAISPISWNIFIIAFINFFSIMSIPNIGGIPHCESMSIHSTTHGVSHTSLIGVYRGWSPGNDDNNSERVEMRIEVLPLF